jgi:hypothetical protein
VNLICCFFHAGVIFRHKRTLSASVADPHQVNADLDPACHFDVDPDPGPDPACHCDAEQDPTTLLRTRIQLIT